jgi:hypothetical protein
MPSQATRRHLATATALAATAATCLAVPALASPGHAAGSSPQRQHFTLYSGNVHNKDITDVIRGTGPIHGVGIAKPNDNATGAIPIHVTLPHGTVLLKARGDFTWKPNLKTCTATEHDTGTYHIVRGTGDYQGITGHGHYTENGAGIGVRSKSGTCEQKFKVNYVVAQFTGRDHIS